jgi:prepilin-type N-terminal cleavage/methylation domain-containing protein
MGAILRKTSIVRKTKKLRLQKGFTLIETTIAILVLAWGVLSLAAQLCDALAYMQGSQADFIAQQKAEEAMEAIFTAKYTSTISFAQIANTNSSPPGIFLVGAQPILQPGPDGLVGTEADSTSSPAYIINPGPDGLMGTADDIDMPLTDYTRTITITPTSDSNLTSVTVTINYTSGRFQRTYSMTSLISAFN